MKKAVIFDLDGVLVDTKKIHYDALNFALHEVGEEYQITLVEHYDFYDGLSTNQKLEKLNEKKNLPKQYNEKIWLRKQEKTLELLNEFEITGIRELFIQLKEVGCLIAICSNTIRETLDLFIDKMKVADLLDCSLSNSDVLRQKPSPEIYHEAFKRLNVFPNECLILEDSINGRKSAKLSNATIFPVNKVLDFTFEQILLELKKEEHFQCWDDRKLTVVIPMAGNGSRFSSKGYKLPKPLIDVENSPMIKRVVDNIGINSKHIFIVQKKHNEDYFLDTMLKLIKNNSINIQVDGITQGAACTVLSTKEHINNDNPILIANSDQIVDWECDKFLYKCYSENLDGAILCFEATDSKWSYARTDEFGNALEVAEKKVISNKATVGIYYWKHGSDFVKYAEQMIEKDIRTNNEFYVCPVFNEAILDGKKIKTFMCKKMHGIGTPEDLEKYLEEINANRK